MFRIVTPYRFSKQEPTIRRNVSPPPSGKKITLKQNTSNFIMLKEYRLQCDLAYS
jgi:hypothetical protein